MDDADRRDLWAERAAIYEFDAGLPRATAERLAAADVERAEQGRAGATPSSAADPDRAASEETGGV